jgi:hypothetical protein
MPAAIAGFTPSVRDNRRTFHSIVTRRSSRSGRLVALRTATRASPNRPRAHPQEQSRARVTGGSNFQANLSVNRVQSRRLSSADLGPSCLRLDVLELVNFRKGRFLGFESGEGNVNAELLDELPFPSAFCGGLSGPRSSALSRGGTVSLPLTWSISSSSRHTWQRYLAPGRGLASNGLCEIARWQAGQRQGINGRPTYWRAQLLVG